MVDNLITQGLATQAATVAANAERARQRELENAGARIADDHFCDCCGKRGVVGTCSMCERAA